MGLQAAGETHGLQQQRGAVEFAVQECCGLERSIVMFVESKVQGKTRAANAGAWAEGFLKAASSEGSEQMLEGRDQAGTAAV